MDEQHGPKGQNSGKKNKKKNKKAERSGDEAGALKGAAGAWLPLAPSGKRASLPKPDFHQQASMLVVSTGDGGRNITQRHGSDGSSNKPDHRNARLSSGGDNKNSSTRVGSGRAGESSDSDRNANAGGGSGKSGDAGSKASRDGKSGSREKAKAERNFARKGDKQNSAEQAKSETTNSNETQNSKGKFVTLEDQELLRELAQHRIFSLKKKNLSFPNAKYFCRLCEYHLDRPQDCERHVDEPRHRRKKEASDTEGILENIPKPSVQQIQALDSIVSSITEKHGLSPPELEACANVVNRLQSFISEYEGDVMLKLYGSSLTGFGMKGCDVNIDVCGPGPAPSLLIKVYNILHEHGEPQFIHTQSDFNAKIPVVQLMDAKTDLRVVLAINGQQAVLTSSLLYRYSLADPRVRVLACTLRCWAQLCHLDRQDEGTLPPFALDLMVVYFLQQLSLPVLCLLPVPQTHFHGDTPKGTMPRKMEELIDFDSLKEQAEKWKSENKCSVGELWLQLLKFYCLEFDNTQFVISILQTEPLTRQAKKWHSKKLAIEDPFAVKKNVANSMANSTIFEYFQSCLRKCYEYFGMPRNKDGNVSISIAALRALANKKTDSLLQENEETCSNASSTSQESPQKESETSRGEKGDREVEEKEEGGSYQSDTNGESVVIKPNQTITERLKAASAKDAGEKNAKTSAHNGSRSKSATSDASMTEDSISGSVVAPDYDVSSETGPPSSVSDVTADSIPMQSMSELDITPEDSVSGVSSSDCYITASELELSASDSAAGSSTRNVSTDGKGEKKLNRKEHETSSSTFMEEESEVGVLVEAMAGLKVSDQEEGWVKLSDVSTADSSSQQGGDHSSSPNSEDEEEEFFSYSFTEDVFTGGKGPAVICGYCEQEGHIKANCPDDRLPSVMPLPALTPRHMGLVDQVIDKIIYDFRPTDNHVRDRERLVKDLESFVQQIYPDARFALFGSSCNGFGFYSSDLDICMTLIGKKVEDIDVVEVIEKVANKLVQRHNLYNVIPIPTAKVPIVKFTDRKTRLDGDISLYNTLAQRNTRLLRCYSEIDYRVKVLGYAVKVFAKVCNIGDASRGSLSSYGYILMMLHYLQQCHPPVIPVLQEFRPEGECPEYMVEGCNTWFFEDLRRLPQIWPHFRRNTDSMGKLWLGFLCYYLEEFDWKGMVVTIRQKAMLTKFEKMWTGKNIAVEDPFDVSHNLGGGLSRKMNNFIYKTFVNGRVHFGTSVDYCMDSFTRYRFPSDYFFDCDKLTDGKPPNDRGCRMCGKIGHLVKDCPNRRGGNKRRQQPQKEKEGKQKNGQNESADGGKKDAKGKDQDKDQDKEGKDQDKESRGQDKEAKGQTNNQAKGQEEPKRQKAKGQEKQQKGQSSGGPVRGGEEAKGQVRGQGSNKQVPVLRDDGEGNRSTGCTVVTHRINTVTGARTSSATISGPPTTTITMAATPPALTTTTTSNSSSPRVPPGFGPTPDRSQPHKDPFSQREAAPSVRFGSPDMPSGPHTSTPVRSVQSGMQPPGVQMNIEQLFSMAQRSGGSNTASLSAHSFISQSMSPSIKTPNQSDLTPEEQVAMLGGSPLYHSSGSPQRQPATSSPGSENRGRPGPIMSRFQPQPQSPASAPQQAGAGSGQQMTPLPLKALFSSSNASPRLGSPGRGEPERMGFPLQQMPVGSQFQMSASQPLSQQQQHLLQQQHQILQQQQLALRLQDQEHFRRQFAQGQPLSSPSQHPQPGSPHDQPTTTNNSSHRHQQIMVMPTQQQQQPQQQQPQQQHPLLPGSQPLPQSQTTHPVGMQQPQFSQPIGSQQSQSAQSMSQSQFGQQARPLQSQFGQPAGSLQSQPNQPVGMPPHSSQSMGLQQSQPGQPLGAQPQFSQPVGSQPGQPMGTQSQYTLPIGTHPSQPGQPMGMQPQFNHPVGSPPGPPPMSGQPPPLQFSHPAATPPQQAPFNQPVGSLPGPLMEKQSQFSQSLGIQSQPVSQPVSVETGKLFNSQDQLAYIQRQQQRQQQLAASMAGTGAPAAAAAGRGPAPPGLYTQPAMPGFSLFPMSSGSQNGRRDGNSISSSIAEAPGHGSPRGNP